MEQRTGGGRTRWSQSPPASSAGDAGEEGMAWRDVGPKPYNSSQGGLQSNAFRERMKTLHYEVAPEVPFPTFQEGFALLACERTGLSYNKED